MKAAGIKDIAEALGVSIGTVDRALHERPGINPITRARVLKMAQTLGYRPNVAARHLKLNRKLVISVLLPKEIAFFFDRLREGITEAARPFQDSVEVEFHTHARLGEGDVDLFAQALGRKTNGIILAPGHPADIRPWIKKAARAQVPVVCVATDAPDSGRLTGISSDSYTSGAMAAELLTRCRQGKRGEILVVTGDLSTMDHAEKVQGVREFIEKAAGPLRLGGVVETYDKSEDAFRLSRAAILKQPKLQALYVSTANSLPVLAALSETGRLQDTAVITTDLFQGLVPYLRNGQVLATLYQRPKTQGRMAFRSIYQFLVEGTCPPASRRLPPHVILQSNLDLFLEMQGADGAGAAIKL